MRATIEELGIDFRGTGQRRFSCSHCGRKGVLSVDFDKGVFRCFRPTCDLHGGGKLVDDEQQYQCQPRQSQAPRRTGGNRTAAQEIWEKSLPLRQEDDRSDRARAGLLYLQGRGISKPESDALRLHPRLWCQEIVARGLDKANGVPPRQPALIAEITDATGEFLGVQRIWLGREDDAEGRLIGIKKAELQSPKKSLGPISGGVVRIDPVGETDTAMAVTEGIETALAVRELAPEMFGEAAVPVWAALSAGNMPSIAPCIPSHIHRVYICADNDKAGRLAAQQLAQRLKATRQQIRVTIRRPRQTGSDYGDLLLTKRTRCQQENENDQAKYPPEKLRA